MIMHSIVHEPVKINGKWEIVDHEETKEYSDDQVRHCNICTVCGMTCYPECTKTCRHGGLMEETASAN